MDRAEKLKNAYIKLLTVALPTGDLEMVKELVDKDCVTNRAGFASLYAATGDPIPQKGNFIEWMIKGWSSLHKSLADQKVEMVDIVCQGDTVMGHFNYAVVNKEPFCGKGPTNGPIHWQEIGIVKFNEEDKMTEMWYMCDELSVAMQLGFKLT